MCVHQTLQSKDEVLFLFIVDPSKFKEQRETNQDRMRHRIKLKSKADMLA